jgi:hypothetical protein
MLTDAERNLLNTVLEKYWPGQSEPILVGDAQSAQTGVAQSFSSSSLGSLVCVGWCSDASSLPFLL